MASDFVQRRISLPRRTSPPIESGLVRSLVRGTRDIGHGQLAPILRNVRLVERHRSVQPALQSSKARFAPAPLDRPAQSSEMGGQRLRRNAVPVGVLNTVDVDRQPGGAVAARKLGRLAEAKPIKERLASIGAAGDFQTASGAPPQVAQFLASRFSNQWCA